MSLTVVTVIAVGVSYGHLYDLATDQGESGLPAAVLPITVDGLILACSLVIVTAARRGDRSPILAWLMLFAGIGATLAGNIAHGVEHQWAGALVAGWPAVVAAGCFHLVIGEMRKSRKTDPVPVPDEQAEPVTEAVAEPWDETAPAGLELWDTVATTPPAITGPVTGDPGLAWLTATTGRDPVPAVATGVPDGDRSPETAPEPVATGLSVVATTGPGEADDETTEPGSGATGPETDPELEQVIATARDHFADMIAGGRTPSIRSIRQEIKVGHPRAQVIREALSKSA
ncbi:hypothetical protein BJF79_22810 [Actinomadura sp. CNU-125]|nr:hypothetical protein BJF79_22810 [Actinomadura sp. CNU-125]